MDVIGIDLGGTNIKAGIINDKGVIKHKKTVPTPVQGGREGIKTALANIISELNIISPKPLAVGIGSAGRIDRHTGTVIFATDNLPGWMGTNVKTELETLCGLPVFVENDVNVAALGEGWRGAAQKYRHYALLTIGTGIGGALVHDGKLVSGPTGSVGEIGHVILYPNGKQCNCGQKGCFEQYVSGSALARIAKQIEPDWDSRILINRAEAGHPTAVRQIELFVTNLATGLITLHNIYDPELIVLGGGVGETYKTWQEKLEQELNRLTPQQLTISPAQLGNDAGLLGAAHLAFTTLRS